MQGLGRHKQMLHRQGKLSFSKRVAIKTPRKIPPSPFEAVGPKTTQGQLGKSTYDHETCTHNRRPGRMHRVAVQIVKRDDTKISMAAAAPIIMSMPLGRHAIFRHTIFFSVIVQTPPDLGSQFRVNHKRKAIVT